MLIEASFDCACCGTTNETTVDLSQGKRQYYVEDCQTCCRPNVLTIDVDLSGDEPFVELRAELEDE